MKPNNVNSRLLIKVVNFIGEYKTKRINKKFIWYFLVLSIFFLVLAMILWLLGFNPIEGLKTLFFTSFRTSYGFWGTVTKFIPLLLLTYAFTVPLKIRLFNIGALGQMQIGALLSLIIAFELSNLPSFVIILIAVVISAIGGGLYAYIAAYLKNRHNINPVITTSMLTFVSNFLVNYVCSIEKYGELSSGFPMTFIIPQKAHLAFWGPVPSWILVVPIVILFYYLIFNKMVIGYKIEATGNNPTASNAYGINAKKIIIITFILAGAISGLAGSIEVLGVHGRLISGFARTGGSDFGTLGSLTSLVAGEGALNLPIAAFLMSILLIGADSMQRTIQVPAEMIYLMQSILVISIVSLRWRMERITKK